MKKISVITLASVVALSVMSTAFADGKKQEMKHMMKMGSGSMMKMKGGHMMQQLMDGDKDGTITQEEFNSFRGKNFFDADKNRNKSLTLKEFAVMAKNMEEQRKKAMAMAKEKAKQVRLKKHFDKLDADGDGKVSLAEFEAKGNRKFIRMDNNDDGVLNMADHKGKMKKMRMKKQHKMENHH